MRNEDNLASSSESPKETEQDSNDFVSLGASDDRTRNKILQRASVALFLTSVVILVFFAGMYVQQSRVFPYSMVSSAYKTLVVALETNGIIRSSDNEYYGTNIPNYTAGDAALDSRGFRPYGCVGIEDSAMESIRDDFRRAVCEDSYTSKDDASASRMELVEGDGFANSILAGGVAGAFTDLCPNQNGCLAVQYSSSGEVEHAYPYFPDKISSANIVSDSEFPYEEGIGWSFSEEVDIISVSKYPDGDLLVTFHASSVFPYGLGVARVAPDGTPRWYRKDYSHHWPHMTDENIAIVPSLRTGRGLPVRLEIEDNFRAEVFDMWCKEGLLDDYLKFIDGDGNLLNEVSILDAIIESPYANLLIYVGKSCNPTHLNFVHVVDDDSGSADGIEAGDLVISLRNLHAFGILDGETYRLKRLVRGSFVGQHAVHHLSDSRFVMFDNSGTDWRGYGPSRLLIVDVESGQETTVFPNEGTPEHLRSFFTKRHGTLSLSPDGRRVLITDFRNGRGLEVRLLDGAVLNIFHNLHDVSGLESFPDEHVANAWYFELFELRYVRD